MKVKVFEPLPFSCPRECDQKETCRWSEILGTDEFVGSHTLKVNTKFKNADAINQAAQRMGATFLGHGKHKLFAGTVEGIGVKLPSWRYPIVIDKEGQIHYDNYEGAWGDEKILDQFRANYIDCLAREIAIRNNWSYVNTENGIRIFAPDGAYIDVLKDGTVKAEGFVGNACHLYTGVIANELGDGVEVERPINVSQME